MPYGQSQRLSKAIAFKNRFVSSMSSLHSIESSISMICFLYRGRIPSFVGSIFFSMSTARWRRISSSLGLGTWDSDCSGRLSDTLLLGFSELTSSCSLTSSRFASGSKFNVSCDDENSQQRNQFEMLRPLSC